MPRLLEARFTPVLLLVLGAALLAGCRQGPIVPATLMPPPLTRGATRPLPDYPQVVEGYNERARTVDWLSARVRARLRWEELPQTPAEAERNRPKRYAEHGEGTLLYAAPHRISLTLGKLGRVGLRLGSNDTQFWLFDLIEEHTLYLGRMGLQAGILVEPAEAFPLPISPQMLPHLLGLVPLDPSAGEAGVAEVAGYYQITPTGLNLRFLLHPRSFRPVRIDVLDETGATRLICLQEDYAPVSSRQRRGERAEIPRVLRVYPVDREAEVRLELHRPHDGAGGASIRLANFDLEVLRQVHRPQREVHLGHPGPVSGHWPAP